MIVEERLATNRHLVPAPSKTLAALVAMLGSMPASAEPSSVAATPSNARTAHGEYISWVEHRIDDEALSGGIPIRGGDGIAIADIDADGHLDIITAQEDSNHLRVAYGTGDPQRWVLRTLADGAQVGAIEDVKIGDLNGDDWPDIVAACEEAHLLYLQNPGMEARDTTWESTIPSITTGRGSWHRVFIADLNGDGRLDLTAANKGAPDIVRPGVDAPADGATSFITVAGHPLDDQAWREQVLFKAGVPNTALPLDVDGDGDLDVLAAKRVEQELVILENLGTLEDGSIRHRPIPIDITAAFTAPNDWRGLANAFQADVADMNGDGRPDLVLNVMEQSAAYAGRRAGLGWLEQPKSLRDPWQFHRIGNTLPDWIIGIHLADLDGDGDLDVMTGGYSGINIIDGTYSGAARDFDEPTVTAASSVGRIAWFENSGNAAKPWQRHDVSRRVRGMYDMFISLDMDGDGDLDVVAPRGNSGPYDGVFWLEQLRTREPRPAFTPARTNESRHLPLPPENWLKVYDRAATYIAPNKAQP